MALRANSTDVYRGGVLVEAPALPKGPKASLTLRREARLAYTILTPTLLVILFVVAYPFCTAIYMSMQDKMVGAPGRFVGLSNYAELAPRRGVPSHRLEQRGLHGRRRRAQVLHRPHHGADPGPGAPLQ
jgi:hypothetical protein